MDCIYCGLRIIRITDHLKYCKLKYEMNIINNKNNLYKSEIINNLSKNPTFKALFNSFHYTGKETEKKFLNTKDEPFINYGKFTYYSNYIIGSGRNMKVFYGKELKDNQDVTVKMEIKNNKESNAINEIDILSN